MRSPRLLLNLGLFLTFPGIVLPFLIVVGAIQSTLFLIFLSWGSSVAGMSLGTIGFVMWSKLNRE